MKIKKTFQGELPENRVVNAKSNSATDAYSANYLNDKLRNVVVSPTEPTTGEDVWIKRSSNILKFDDFTKTVNGITFTMKDQVLHVEGTATAYTQECYLPINLTLEEAMTLTVDWNDDNLVPKAAYTYNGTSYYPNLYSQELEPGTYLNQLYFIIASGATVNTDVRFQLEKGRGFSGWQPVMEKAILVKNDNDVYEDLIKKSIHVGVDKPKNGEEVWVQKGKNLFDKNNANIFNGLVDGNSLTWQESANGNYVILEVKPNTTYTLSKKTAISEFAVASATNTPYIGMVVTKMILGSGKTELSITTGENDKYLHIYVYYNTVSSGTLEETLNSLEVEEGSSITPKKIYTKNANGGYDEFVKNVSRNIMYAYLSAETVVTTGSDQRAKVPVDKYEFIGDKLSFDADKHAIVIGKGVSKVAISALLSYKQSSDVGLIALNLFYNGSNLTQRFVSPDSTQKNYALVETSLPILTVSEGDIITLVIRTVASTDVSIRLYDGKSSSMLCVEVLE